MKHCTSGPNISAKGGLIRMCMANAYVEKNGQKVELFKEVATLQVNGGNLVLKTLFGERKSIQAEIKEIDFVNSRILLGEIEEEIN